MNKSKILAQIGIVLFCFEVFHFTDELSRKNIFAFLVIALLIGVVGDVFDRLTKIQDEVESANERIGNTHRRLLKAGLISTEDDSGI
jgi:hypothetical protein